MPESTPTPLETAPSLEHHDDDDDDNNSSDIQQPQAIMRTTTSSSSSSSPRHRTTKCRMLPHGSFPLFIATLSTLAWCGSLFEDGCDYAKVSGPIVAQLLIKTPSYGGVLPFQQIPPYLEFGLSAFRHPDLVYDVNDSGSAASNNNAVRWETDYHGACLEYPLTFEGTNGVQHDLQDTAWTASKALSFLALALGGGATLMLWCFTTCCVFTRGTWRWAAYELLLAALCQCASFCWFATNVCEKVTVSFTEPASSVGATINSCDLLWGSRTDILSAVLWMTCAILALRRYPPPIVASGVDEEQRRIIRRSASSSVSQEDGPHHHASVYGGGDNSLTNVEEMHASEPVRTTNAQVV